MSLSDSRWKVVAPSRYAWEQEAFDFIRQGLPDHDPWRAWQNFEFIADDGSINEVDLLVFSPEGLFLIEIKSRGGTLTGDAGTWTWKEEGRLHTVDNPLLATNLKAKKLRSLLDRQRAAKKGPAKIPFIEALVFCSAPDLSLRLQGTARSRVCLRDLESEPPRPERADPAAGDLAARPGQPAPPPGPRPPQPEPPRQSPRTPDSAASPGAPAQPARLGRPARPGILAALRRREAEGLERRPRSPCDRPAVKVLAQAMDEAGIRPSRRSRRVKDWLLEHVVAEGRGWQDWQAAHVSLPDTRRRVRLYLTPPGTPEEERRILERAARREFQLLESLQHPGILRVLDYTEHETGPALVFEHDASALRLDHWMAQRGEALGVDERLDLLRQVAEAVRFAHEKRVIHRALSPQSILVASSGPEKRPVAKVLNWQAGFRGRGSTTGAPEVLATEHVGDLVEDASAAYMAPEAVRPVEEEGEHLDVFSLGAIAWFLVSGAPPAASALELHEKLREGRGLEIGSVVNGAVESLRRLVEESTRPDVAARLGSAREFLDLLEAIEEELTRPEEDTVDDPARAGPGSRLPGGYEVVRRLGTGATSVVLLVRKGDEEFALKVASGPEHDERIAAEGEVLQKLRHQHIVDWIATIPMGGRTCLLTRPAGPETLGERIRKEGPLQVELLHRFGEDLLQLVVFLEEQGIPHRDLKPDNIGVGKVGRGDRLHLVLFDFSLSRTPPENIRAGTGAYLDPFLPLRKPPRWDLHAERWAAAVTLYELATGRLPRWGDGKSDPSLLECEATLEPDLFETSLRDGLLEFFRKALGRDPAARHDNAEDMLRSWRDVFEKAEKRQRPTPEPASDDEVAAALAAATLATPIHDLGLGTRARNALDRVSILTVDDLLRFPYGKLVRLKGVGSKTRREISTAVRILKARLVAADAAAERLTALGAEPGKEEPPEDAASPAAPATVDAVARRVLGAGGARRRNDSSERVLRALLGLDAEPEPAAAPGSVPAFRIGPAARPAASPAQAAPRGPALEPAPAVPPAHALQPDPGLPAASSPQPATCAPTAWRTQAEVAERVRLTRGRVAQVLAKSLARWRREPSVTRLRDDIREILRAQGGVMTFGELADAVLIARGSDEDGPVAARLARCAVRAAVEVERSMAEPEFLVRRSRSGAAVIIARTHDLADWALRLGDAADRIAREETILPPARMLEKLRDVGAPEGPGGPEGEAPLSDARLVRLAVGASGGAALSSRQEIYPRGLDASRAFRLAVGTLGGTREFSVEDVREAVRSRYPDAETLPDRPELDRLIAAEVPRARWSPEAREGRGAWVVPPLTGSDVTSGSSVLQRRVTEPGPLPVELTPEVATARQLEEKLERAIRDGAFLALQVEPKQYESALEEFRRRFPVEVLDLEAAFIRALRETAERNGVRWDLVLQADAAPGTDAWEKLLRLVRMCVPGLETSILASKRTVLLVYPGLLARWEQLGLLERLRDRVGRPDGVPGLWILIPQDEQQDMPFIDDRAVPVIGPGQRARIPASWIRNEHRAGNGGSGPIPASDPDGRRGRRPSAREPGQRLRSEGRDSSRPSGPGALPCTGFRPASNPEGGETPRP